MTENGAREMVTETGDPGMVTENGAREMVTETGDPGMVTENGAREMVTETGDPGMVTNAKAAKTGAGILTEDKEEVTELEVKRIGIGKTVEKQTLKNHAKEVGKTDLKEKGRAPGTEKAGGSKESRTTPEEIVPARNQKARRLQQRKAWEVFCPNFLASKTSFGPQNEVIHAHSGSI